MDNKWYIYGEYSYFHWTLSKGNNIIGYCLPLNYIYYDSPLNCNNNWCYIKHIHNDSLYQCDPTSLTGDDGSTCNNKPTIGQIFAIFFILVGCAILIGICGYIWHIKQYLNNLSLPKTIYTHLFMYYFFLYLFTCYFLWI